MPWIHIEPMPQALTVVELRVKELLDQGWHYMRIAAKLHISFETCREIIYSIRKKECILEMRIAEEKKAQILDLHHQGMSQLNISLEVGCALSTVHKVLKQVDTVDAVITEPESTDAEPAPEITEPQPASPPAEVTPKEPPQAVILAVSDAINTASDKIDKNLFAIRQLEHENAGLRDQIESLIKWLKEVGAYEGIAD